MRDITLEETIYVNFTTRSFSTGVPTSLLGTPVLSVLESNNATPITAGVSVSVDRASVTGLNQATIVATAANGYEAGKSYGLYISTGTVGGVSVVGEVVAQFTVQSGAAFTRLGAPAGASIAADLVVIDNFVDGLEATIGAAGAGLTALGDTRIANLDAAVSGRMATYAQPTGFLAATFPASIASPTNITAATGITVAANNDKSGYSLTATTGLGNQTANITGNLSGTVGSVTGAVGSVTAAVAITSNIKQNQALSGFTFLMTDSANHNPATGLTVTVTRSIDGAAFAAGTLSAVTEVSNGIYSVNFGAGDLNGKVIILQATAAGADTTFERIVTQI